VERFDQRTKAFAEKNALKVANIVRNANYLSKNVIMLMVQKNKTDPRFVKGWVDKWLQGYHGILYIEDFDFPRGGIIREAFVFDFSKAAVRNSHATFSFLDISPSMFFSFLFSYLSEK
jgi:hypothetical protein